MKRSYFLASMALTIFPLTQAQAYQEAVVEDGGGVRGVIRLDGDPPKEEHTLISKDNHVCGEGHTVTNPVSIDANGGLASAVVHIKGIEAGKPWADTGPVEIVQENCEFSPYVQVVPELPELTITNNDPLLHNIHTYEIIGRARRTLFNIAQPNAGQVDTRQLKLRKGNVVQVECDAHNWMSAWIYTSDNPYVSVSAGDGTFSIEDIPPGSYELSVWHPTLGETTQQIAIQAGQNVDTEIALPTSGA